jgi:hypothetical protein
MDLSTVDDRVQELARKAIKKSGGQFFATLQKRVTAYIETIVAESVDADDFEAAKHVLTSDNLLLLARHYAGEITASKRKRGGAPTNAEKVKTLLKNTPARLVDLIKSAWDDAAETAKSGDWEALESAMGELNELDA